MRNTFPRLFGNAEITKRLSSLIISSSLPHAMIIVGPEGSGKHTLALETVSALNCENRLSESFPLPCGACSRCKRIASGAFPDVSYLKREVGKSTIGVDELRAFREDMFLSATESECKCYIIEDADAMTPAAQNALLKVLEEPPKNVYIILICKEADKLLTTIKSRAQSFSTEIFIADELHRHVLSLSPEARSMAAADPEKLRGILLSSNGIIGKALSHLGGDESDAEALRASVMSIVSVMPKKVSFSALYSAVAALPQKRDELRRTLELLVTALRDMLTYKVSGEFTPSFFTSLEACEGALTGLGARRIVSIFEVINSALADLDKNVLIAPLLTDIALKIREA